MLRGKTSFPVKGVPVYVASCECTSKCSDTFFTFLVCNQFASAGAQLLRSEDCTFVGGGLVYTGRELLRHEHIFKTVMKTLIT